MKCACLLIALGLVVGAGSVAVAWPHWRGPARNGVIEGASGWREGKWIDRRPLWEANVGEGASSPLVVDGRLYALGHRRGEEQVVCLDAATGEEIWQQAYKAPRYGRNATGDEGLYSGSTATPEFDPQSGFLYTLGIDGDLNCWDARQQGRPVWSLNLYDQYRAEQRPRVGRSGRRDYGYTTAPLVHNDWLLVEVGSQQGTVVALDKRTGRQAWLSQQRDHAGHSGGLAPIEVEGVPCAAVMTFEGLLVMRLDDGRAGETVATYEWKTEFANNIASVAVHEDSVLITSAYNHHAICRLKVTLNGASPVWQKSFASKVCTPVIYKGHVYWAWQKLRCLDFETGAQRWEGGRFGDAGSCIVTGDGRLIVYGGRGTLALVETADRSPQAYRELARFDNLFSGDVWPHVVLAAGRIYCKDRQGAVKCLRIE